MMGIRFTYLHPRPLQVSTGLTLALILASLIVNGAATATDLCGLHEYTDESTTEGPCIVVLDDETSEVATPPAQSENTGPTF